MLNETPPLNSDDLLAHIGEIRNRLKNRLDNQKNLDKALETGRWEDAYKIARETGLDIYDPFSTFREAREDVTTAGQSIENVIEKKEKLRLEIQKIIAYDDAWKRLDLWNDALVSLKQELLDGSKSFQSDFLESLQKVLKFPIISEVEHQFLSVWAGELNEEANRLRKVDDLEKLRQIKDLLFHGENLTSEDFKWLISVHQKVPNSRILNRLYAKAEQRFFNQPAEEMTYDYRSDFDDIEFAFKYSQKKEFDSSIKTLEAKLLTEKDTILHKIYQSDLNIWKQRLLDWERVLESMQEIEKFKSLVCDVTPKSCARAWLQGQDLMTFSAALLDLRDIQPEIFVLQPEYSHTSIDKSTGKSIVDALDSIGDSLDISQDALSRRQFQIAATDADYLVDEAVRSQWRDYFKDMKTWMNEQLEIGHIFMDSLVADTLSQDTSPIVNREISELKTHEG